MSARMNPYSPPTSTPNKSARPRPRLTVFQRRTLRVSAIAMLVGTGYVSYNLFFPRTQQLSWERDMEVWALVGLWILYLLISVVGALLLLRCRNPTIRDFGTLVAAIPFFIVSGSFISLLFS